MNTTECILSLEQKLESCQDSENIKDLVLDSINIVTCIENHFNTTREELLKEAGPKFCAVKFDALAAAKTQEYNPTLYNDLATLASKNIRVIERIHQDYLVNRELLGEACGQLLEKHQDSFSCNASFEVREEAYSYLENIGIFATQEFLGYNCTVDSNLDFLGCIDTEL